MADDRTGKKKNLRSPPFFCFSKPIPLMPERPYRNKPLFLVYAKLAENADFGFWQGTGHFRAGDSTWTYSPGPEMAQ